jgi:hypothetical protein
MRAKELLERLPYRRTPYSWHRLLHASGNLFLLIPDETAHYPLLPDTLPWDLKLTDPAQITG